MQWTTPRWEPGRIHLEICRQLERVARKEVDRLMLLCPPQHGKQVADETPVLTPDGWKTHGELTAGCFVFGGDGLPTRVVAVSDKTLATFEVEFVDGERIKCHGAHEWEVYCRNSKRGERQVVETRWLASQDLWTGDRGKRGSRAMFSVDWVGIAGHERDLPCDPYVLGAWLGDGTTTSATICAAPGDVAVLEAVGEVHQSSSRWSHKGTGVESAYFSGLRSSLRKAGVLGNKHIPEAYFVASLEQRGALLAGLMDTDGYIHHGTRRACFSTCDKRLADDVATLVRTFGVRVTIAEFEPCLSSSGIQGRKSVYQVTFSPTMEIPCILDRKKVAGFDVKHRKRAIVDIRPCDPVTGNCIQVSNEDGIYLVGRGLVPTHNSQITSKRLPAYMLGLDPTLDIISASATGDLATEFGGAVRDCVRDPAFKLLFPGTDLSESSQAKGRWETAQGGGYYAVGIGGALFGRGSGLAIVDDPFSTWEDAQSTTAQARVWEWYRGTLYNRVRPGGAIIVIQHRTGENDLVAKLLDEQEHGGDKWEVVRLPADPEDPPWPERYDRDALLRLKANMTPMMWSSLYMQDPTPAEGSFFKRDWFHDYDEAPKGLRVYGATDGAVTPEAGDFTEHGVFGVDASRNVFVLDWWFGQKSADVWIDKMADMIELQSEQRGGVLCWFGESGPIKRAIEPFMVKRLADRGAYCRVEWLASIHDKGTRALPIQAMMSMGKVFWPKHAAWKAHVQDQLLRFTGQDGGKHDDAVDVMSLFARGLKFVSSSKPKTRRSIIAPIADWMMG